MMRVKNLKRGYNGYELPADSRATLLQEVSALFPKVIAHHVTYEFGIYDSLPPQADTVEVIAKVDNGESIQAVIVKVNGTHMRPKGRVFHITVSLDPAKGATPHQSNDVIRDFDWQYLAKPLVLPVTPKFFAFGS